MDDVNGAKLVTTQHIVIQDDQQGTGGQHVVIQEAVPDTSAGLVSTGSVVENIELSEDGNNVVYIVQQEGLDMDGVTYTVMEEGATGQTFTLQGDDPNKPGLQITEDKILQALSTAQYEVVEATSSNDLQFSISSGQVESNGQYIATRSMADSSSALLQSSIAVSSVEGTSGQQFITIQGQDGEQIVNSENVEFVFTCQFCELSVTSLDDLKQHIRADHSAETSEGYDENMVTVLTSCSYCSETFTNETEFRAHMAKHENKELIAIQGPPHENNVQDEISYQSSKLAGLVETDFDYYKCPWCSQMFSTKLKAALESHVKESHPGREARDAQLVRINKLTPQNTPKMKGNFPASSSKHKQSTCRYCDKVFKGESELVSHMKDEHSAVGLDEKAITLSSIGTSTKDEVLFPCLLCDKLFKWPKSLKNHMLDIHSSDTHDKKFRKSGKKGSTKESFFKCMYCTLVTRYACSVRTHISRKHPEMVEDIDVTKLSIPRVANDKVAESEVISLDKRPAEVRLSGFSKIFRCPFSCDYATQLPSNMTRHLTSRNHNYIFTHEELKKIKVSSFRVTVDGRSRNSKKLPDPKFSKSLKVIIDEKKKRLGLPITDDDLLTEVREVVYTDIFDDEEQELHEYSGDEKDENTDTIVAGAMDTSQEFDDASQEEMEIRESIDSKDTGVQIEGTDVEGGSTKKVTGVSPNKYVSPTKYDKNLKRKETLVEETGNTEVEEVGDVQEIAKERSGADARSSQKTNTKGPVKTYERKLKQMKQSVSTVRPSSDITEIPLEENVNQATGEQKQNKQSVGDEEAIDQGADFERSELHPAADTMKQDKGKTFKRKTVKCVFCHKPCEGIKQVLQHMTSHENVKVSFSCQHCENDFFFFSKLKEHIANKHGAVSETCTPFEAVAITVIESQRKKQVTTYDCPYCEMLFSHPTPLQQHVRLDHEKHLNAMDISMTGRKIISGYNCFYCELSYMSLTDLVRHMHVVHAGVERPGVVEDQSDTPMRKSSRKRKMPKWLENDMAVEDETKPKKRKTEQMSIRISSLSQSELGESKSNKSEDVTVTKVQISTDTSSSPVKNTHGEVEVIKMRSSKQVKTEPINIGTPEPPKKASDAVSRSGKKKETVLKSKTPVNNNKNKAKQTEKNVTPVSTIEQGLSKNEPKQNTRRQPRKSLSMGMKLPVTPDILPENRCPHCDFTAKRSSALNFHINFNHQNIKSEPIDFDTDEPIKSNKASKPAMRTTVEKNIVDESVTKTSPETNRTINEEIRRGLVAHGTKITGDDVDRSVEGVVMDFEDIADIDLIDEIDDHDQDDDYIPENDESASDHVVTVISPDGTSQTYQKCPYCKNRMQSPEELEKHIQQTHPEKMNVLVKGNNISAHTCAYCKETFKTKAAVKNHVKYQHSFQTNADRNRSIIENVLEGQSAYKCTVCPVLSNSVDGILLHTEISHPLEIDVTENDIKQVKINPGNIQVKFLCPYCSFKSKWKSAIPRHVERHHSQARGSDSPADVICEPEMGEHIYMCPYCMGLMETKECVIEHARLYHSSQSELTESDVDDVSEETDTDGLMKCPYCNTHSKYKRCIVRHVKRIHPEMEKEFNPTELREKLMQVFRCEYCTLETKYRGSFIRHIARMHPHVKEIDLEKMICQSTLDDSQYYSCKYCEVLHTSKAEVLKHVTETHRNQPQLRIDEIHAVGDQENEGDNNNVFYRCPICKTGNRYQRVVLDHMRETHEHTEEFDAEDLICEMNVTKNFQNMYVCKYCKFGANCVEMMSRHSHIIHGRGKKVNYKLIKMKTYEEVMNVYNCPSCVYTSMWRRTVIKHVKTVHPEVQSFTVGDVMCSLRSVAEALRIETGYFMCPYCDASCKWKKSVIRHIKMSHPGLPDNVEIRTCGPDYYLGDHPGNRKGTKLLQCKRCPNQVFRNIPGLKRHYIQYHPEHAENCLNQTNFQYMYTSVPASAVTGTAGPSEGGKREQHRCMICGAMYLWKKSLHVHVRANHREQREVYQVLDKIMDLVVDSADDGVLSQLKPTEVVQPSYSKPALPVKKRRHGKRCGLCSAVFNRKWAVRAHYRLKHGQSGRKRIYRTGLSSFQKTCRICGLGFFTSSALLQHNIKRHRNQPLTHLCGNCGRKFPGHRSFLGHKVLCCHQSTKYSCDEDGCHFSSRFAGVMQHHCRVAHGVKNKTAHKRLRCEICSMVAGSMGEFRKHIVQHQRNRVMPVYQCKFCDTKLATQALRNQHMSELHGHVLEMCDVCGEILSSKKKLQQHMKKHRDLIEVACPFCEERMASQNLSNHYVQHHPDMISCDCAICSGTLLPGKGQAHTCRICNMNFCQKIGLYSHNQEVHGAMKSNNKKHRTYECKVCQQVFFTQKAMSMHVGSEHNIRSVLKQENQMLNDADRYEPIRNTETAKAQDDGDEHPTTHVIHIGQGENTQYLPKLGEVSLNAVIKELIVYDSHVELPYKCILCGRCFGKSKYIKLHIRRSHVKDENQPYRCKICGSGFVRLTEFRKHTRSHSDFRPYKCKFCNKAFKQQANLKEHYYVHSDAKHYQCFLCSREFRQRGALTSHVVGHDTVKPFKCMFCGKGFTTRGELSRHMKKYDQEGMMQDTKCFSCHMCMESFPHFPLLLKHIDQHNPEKPFQCHCCTEKFSNYVAMYFHKVKQQHFQEAEILGAVEELAKKGVVPRKNKTSGRKSNVNQMELNQPMQETVYLSQAEDGSLLEHGGESTIEVIIEDIDQAGVVQIEEKQPEHEELLSIAQQLTELSSIAEKGSLLKEEDEIIKHMLDADADVLASLNKQSHSDYDSKWAEHSNQNRRSNLRSYLEEPTNEISIQRSVRDDPIYIPGMDAIPQPQETEEGQVEIQMDIPASGQAPMPANMEELANLIAQSTESGQRNDVLAYQNEDGSVIYVCMPEKNDESGDIGENQVIETEVTDENIVASTIIAENAETSQEMYTELEEGDAIENGDQVEELVTVTEQTEGHDEVVESMEEETTENVQVQQGFTHIEVENSGGEDEDLVAAAAEVQRMEEENVEGRQGDEEQVIYESDDIQEIEAGSIEVDEVKDEEVVEYQNDETTFIKEELLDVEYQQAMEQNEELMVMYGNFKYTFVKDEKCFTCLHCNAKISSYKNLKGHLQRHLPEKRRPFQCSMCGKRFITKNELNRHWKIHTGERDHICHHCNKGFVQAGQLAEHVRVHTGEKPFKCSNCPASFVTGSQRKQHWRRNHGEKTYACNKCDEKFKSMPDLTIHKGRMHSSLKKPEKSKETVTEGGEHICHICGQPFETRGVLMSHLFNHSMENVTFKCAECEKEFKSKESLNCHKKAKHDGLEHVCQHCGETFAWRRSLQRHVQLKHGGGEGSEAKPRLELPCDECGKLFANTSSLRYHMGSQHVN